VGWRRINLGGALVEEQVAGAEGKVPYRPKGEDPFPQPPEFAKGGEATPPMPKALREAGSRNGSGGGNGSGSGSGSRSSSGTRTSPGAGNEPASQRAGARVDLERLDGEVAGKVATAIRVSVAVKDTFRGERVEVSGMVESGDGKPGGLAVEIYLDGPGGALRVGEATAGGDGAWRATIEVPRDLPLGDHRVVARTPGDASRRPSRSR